MRKNLQTILMLMLLMMTGARASADNYKGTMERHGVKMEYEFGGGTVTKKDKPIIAGDAPRTAMAVMIDGEVKPGATLTASCRKLSGIEMDFKEMTVSGTIKTKNGTIREAPKNEDNNKAHVSFSVPSDAAEVDLIMRYRCWRTTLECHVKWVVTSNTSATPVRPTEPETTTTGNGYKGTITRQGMTLEYSIKGVTMIKKEKPVYQGNNPREGNYFQSYWVAVQSGKKISVSCKKLKGKKEPIIKIDFNYYDTPSMIAGEIINTNTARRYTERTESSTVQKKKFGEAVISYLGDTGDWITVTYNLNIDGSMDSSLGDSPAPTTPQSTNTGNMKWNDISPDENCPVCKEAYSHYEVLRVSGEAGQRCKDRQGNFATVSLIDPVYYYDYIATKSDGEVTLFYGDKQNTITIKPNSTVMCAPLTNGNDRWYVYKGAIVGQQLKHSGKVKPTLQLTNCTAYPKGTVYVAEDDGKTSRVYLLSGSMEVTSKKGGKKVTLKPGQASTVSSNGQQKVQQFDVQKLAKKYGIGITGTGNTGLVFTVDKLHYKILNSTSVEVTGEVRGIYEGHVKIPAKVSHDGKDYQVIGIGPKAFADQTKLTSVDIPTSILGIAEDAFLNTGLTQVTVPGDKTKINKHAFRNCKKLTVVIANGKKPQCSAKAFVGCTNMSELRIRGINESNNGKKLDGTNAVIKVIK